MDRRLLILALLLWAAPARAQEGGLVPVLFVTEPTGAVIEIQNSASEPFAIGESGKVAYVDRDRLAEAYVTFRMPGHTWHGGPVLIRTQDLEGETPYRFPRTGFFRLEPDDWSVAMRDLWARKPLEVVLGSAMLLGIGFVLWRSRSSQGREVDRARWIESLALRAEASRLKKLGCRMGAFRLVRELGSGGMAEVYESVRDEDWNLPEAPRFAVKVMRPELAEDEEFRRRFRREARLLQEMDHPSIVRLVDWGEEQGEMYLVQEFVEGDKLRDHLAPSGLPLEDVLLYARPLMQGLQHAHEREIVHRDLKPENVMVTERRRVKILDFGVARSPKVTVITDPNSALGTLEYMAPEQLVPPADSPGPTPLVDQYAAGVILFELLTGRRPFPAEGFDIVTYVLTEDPPSPADVNPRVPPAVAQVVLRMLQKKPEDRFPSVRAALEALEEAISAR